MKVTNITNIDGLFKVIDNCVGKVELVTNEGDRLLAKVFSDGKIEELELVAYEKEDINRLINFMYNGL